MTTHPATPEQAAEMAERARVSNLLVDAARLDSILDALIDAEGFQPTMARVQRALLTQAERRRVPGWIA